MNRQIRVLRSDREPSVSPPREGSVSPQAPAVTAAEGQDATSARGSSFGRGVDRGHLRSLGRDAEVTIVEGGSR
jgi:hypothetical protein